MSSISIKGIIVGHLAGIAGGFVFSLVMIIAFASPYEAGDFDRLADALSSGSGLAVALAVSAMIWIGAGYVAARVAGRGELINGTLSSLGYVAVSLYSIATLPGDELPILDALDIAAAPLLGTLGGYLRLRQRRQVQPT